MRPRRAGRVDAGVAPYAQRYAGALSLLALSAALPNTPDRMTPRLAALMLGTYVLHPIVFTLGVEPALRWCNLARIGALRTAFGYSATLALVALLRRTRLRHVL